MIPAIFSPGLRRALYVALLMLVGAGAVQATMPMIELPRPIRFQGRQIVLDAFDTSGLGAGTVVRVKVKQSDHSYATFTTQTDAQGRFTIALDATGLLDRDAIQVSIERDGGLWPKTVPTVRERPDSPSNAVPAPSALNAPVAICTSCSSDACRAFSPEIFTRSNEATDGAVQLVDGTVLTRHPVLSFPTRMLGFELVLHHQSLTTYDGPLGGGWSHTFNAMIVQLSDDEAWFVTPDLRVFRIIRQTIGGTVGETRWVLPEGFFGTLDRNEQLQRWTFTHFSGVRYEFLSGARGFPGPLLAIEDTNGNRSLARLDASGFLIEVVTDLGQSIRFGYGFEKRLSSVTDPMGRTSRFGYDHRGSLGAVHPPRTDAADIGPGREITDNDLPQVFLRNCIRTTRFKYDNPQWPHHVTRVVDPRGAVPVAYAYDQNGRAVTRTVNGRDITYTYGAVNVSPAPLPLLDDANSITTKVDRAGNVTHFEFHGPGGEPTSDKGAFGVRRQVEWTESGKGNPPLRPGGATAGGEPLYRERRWLHDCDCLAPKQASQFFASGAGVLFDENGMPKDYPTEIFTYNADRQVTDYEYRGGPGESIRWAATYGALGRKTSYTEPRGFDDTPLYAGRSFKHIYEYDPKGNLTAHIAPTVTLGVTAPQSIRESWTYSNKGQVESHVDANHNVTVYTYHSGPVGGGTVNTKGEFAGFVASMTRGAQGSADPAANLTTRFKVNAVGMVTERTDPRGLVYTTEFNDMGEVILQLEPVVTLANGQKAQYETIFIPDGAGNRVMERRRNVAADGTVPANDFIDRSQSFDAVNNRLSERVEVDSTDANDLVTRFAYDPNDQLVVVQKPEGNRTLITYDEWRLPFKTFYGVAPGASPAQSYPTDKRADTLNGASFVGMTVADYDARGNKTRQTDGKGFLTRREFDFRNRLEKETDPNGSVRRSSYDDASNVITETRGSEATVLERTYFRFDEAGRHSAVGRDLDLAGNESTVASLGGSGLSVARTAYDAKGRVVGQIDANGNATTFTYEAADLLLLSHDALGNLYTRFYDASSNLIRVEELEVAGPGAGGPSELYVTTHDYDELNRRIATHVRGLDSSIDHVTRFAYDSRGNLIEVTDAEGQRSVSTFDEKNRLVQLQRFAADGTELVHHEHGYDENGNKLFDLALSEVTDPGSAQVTRYAYDALDRLIRTVYPDSDDPIDGSGNGPDGVYDRVENAYDASSNLVEMKEQRGVVLHSTFDDGNRLVRVDVIPPPFTPPEEPLPGERARTFEYDPLNRLVEARNDFSLTQREYDALSRLEAETQSVRLDGSGFVNSYEEPVRVEHPSYDLEGNRLLTTVTAGGETDIVVRRTPDALNRVDAIEASLFFADRFEPVADYSYFGPSRIVKKELGNGAFLERTYDAKRRVAQHSWETGGATVGTLLAGFEYAYDDVDNALFERFVHDGGTFDNFGYNPRYELTGVSFRESDPVDYRTSAGPFSDSFAYDDIFNRKAADFGDPLGALPKTVDAYEANSANEYTKITRNGVAFAPEHDRAGNSTSLLVRPLAGPDSGKDVAATAKYDAFNRLVEVTAGSNPTQHNRHDAFNRRIAILELVPTTAGDGIVRSASRRFVYDGWSEIEERRFTRGTTAEAPTILDRLYVQGPRIDELLVTAVDGTGDRLTAGTILFPRNTPGGPDYEYYTLDNRMGFVMALLDATDPTRVLETYRYSAFGEVEILASEAGPTQRFSPGVNRFLYTGRRLDAKAGLYDYRMRFMEARSGRFLGRDWIATSNLYAYVDNAPTNATDPVGLVKLSFPRLLDPECLFECFDSVIYYPPDEWVPGLPLPGEFCIDQCGIDDPEWSLGETPRPSCGARADGLQVARPAANTENCAGRLATDRQACEDLYGGGRPGTAELDNWIDCQFGVLFDYWDCLGGVPWLLVAVEPRASVEARGASSASFGLPGKDCIPGCVCVTAEGCPCCEGLWPFPAPLPQLSLSALTSNLPGLVAGGTLPIDTLPTRKNYCCGPALNNCIEQGNSACPQGTVLVTK